MSMLLDLAQQKFLFSIAQDRQTKEAIKQQIMKTIVENEMAPYYQLIAEELGGLDNALFEKMKQTNAEKLKKLQDTLADAQENLGESEVREALLAIADHYGRIGDKENAIKQYKVTFEKTIGAGQKIDIILILIRIGLFYMDHDLITKNIEQAKVMAESSDWDRKNRLKAYEALYFMSTRKFKKAAHLLLETLATFSAVELIDYETFIFYTVLMSIFALDRVNLKQKVIDAPEILQVIDSIPNLSSLLNSLYKCQYANFFVALAAITDTLKMNRFLAPHAGFYCKELRVIAYSQMLESYHSVQLKSMANIFGITVDFLDKELSRFIVSGRLHCKIDKVAGVVETTRPNSKNAQYQDTIKSGDQLLNRIQKLSRVITASN